MKAWIILCVLAVIGCKSSSPPPTEDEHTEAIEEPTAVQAGSEAPPTSQPEAPAAEPKPATPSQALEPPPDLSAPPDVAAPPKGAKRSKSGLAWKVLKKGKAGTRPSKFDTVTINYIGWTPDGRPFDTSLSRGGAMAVPLNRLIYGMSEALQMMRAGEKRRLWIPGKLGYGEQGSGTQPAPRQPLGMLVFDVELVSFEKAPELPPAPRSVGRVPADAEKSISGLAWRVLETGTGVEHPKDTSVVEIRYTVWTADGEPFESSLLRGGVDTVGVRRLIPGWAEGMKLMVEGERRIFWIPEDLAYQGQPYRPEGMLVVDVALVQIRRDMHQVR